MDMNERMVIEKLQKLKQDKAGRADELVLRLFILIQDEISYPLTLLFKQVSQLKQGLADRMAKTAVSVAI